MTPKSQRIAIAQACGWTYRENTALPTGAGWMAEQPLRFASTVELLPDYLNDLNAMAAAERWLRDQPDHEYSPTSIDGYDQYLFTHFGPRASATQRAEAFLHTIGKWDDSL